MAPLDVVRLRKGLAVCDLDGEPGGGAQGGLAAGATVPTEQALVLFNEGNALSLRQSSKALQRARTKAGAVAALTRGGGGKRRTTNAAGRRVHGEFADAEYRVPGQKAQAVPPGMSGKQAAVPLQVRTVGGEGSGKFGRVTTGSQVPALLAARETGRVNTALALSISSDDE